MADIILELYIEVKALTVITNYCFIILISIQFCEYFWRYRLNLISDSCFKSLMNVDFYDLESKWRTINNESLVNRDSYAINWKFNSVLLSTSCGKIKHLWHHRLLPLKIYKFKLSSPPSNIFHSFWYTACSGKIPCFHKDIWTLSSNIKYIS